MCIRDRVQVESRACMEFYKGKLEGKDTVVVRSGIGKVNAAMCAQILADRYAPSCIINTGIAGSLDARINIGDIVISTDALQHDMDARAFGLSLIHIWSSVLHRVKYPAGRRKSIPLS